MWHLNSTAADAQAPGSIPSALSNATTTSSLLQTQLQASQARPQLQLLAPACCSALLVFTSGTTSRPKGVLLSHASLHSQSLVKLALVGYCNRDVYLHLAPLYHIGGLSSAFAALMAGCKHVFLPRFSPASTLEAIERHRVTAFIAVPTMLQDLVMHAAAERAPEPSPARQGVKRILVGAGGTSLALQDAVAELFPAAHLESAYGMTEACSSITFQTLRAPFSPLSRSSSAAVAAVPAETSPQCSSAACEHEAVPAHPLAALGVCVGRPAPGTQVIIEPTADHDGAGLRPGPAEPLVGEVLTRGPHVMTGYWQDPQATAQALTQGGWLRTGDLGWVGADGRLWLVGRAKDMIKSGGENVFASEVERVLLHHPAVAAAAVVGLPHERLGEQVAALLVLRPGWQWHPGRPATAPPAARACSGLTAPPQQPQQAQSLSLQLLQEHCRAHGLAGFKLPRFAAGRADPLPTNSSGKVVKPLVRQALQAHQLQHAAVARSKL